MFFEGLEVMIQEYEWILKGRGKGKDGSSLVLRHVVGKYYNRFIVYDYTAEQWRVPVLILWEMQCY